MNFFQFLQNKTNEEPKVIESKVIKKPKSVVKSDNQVPMVVDSYVPLHRGQRVKIVYKLGSMYNHYKGYIGEIKEIYKGCELVTILLHATNIPKAIRVPLDHFVPIHN
jgi:hypothetical protein